MREVKLIPWVTVRGNLERSVGATIAEREAYLNGISVVLDWLSGVWPKGLVEAPSGNLYGLMPVRISTKTITVIDDGSGS